MPALEDVTRLKSRVDKLREEKARADGALSQILRRLKTEYGVETLEEAETLLGTIQQKAQAAEAEFATAYEGLLKKYPELR